MPSDSMHCLFDSRTIAARVSELGAAIDHAYSRAQAPLVAVCVLKGAFVFFADLIRQMQTPLELDFVRLASYGQQTTRQEKVHFSKDIEVSVQGKHVLIVEDIVDTGHTLAYLKQVFQARRPSSIAVCSLIHKTGRREIDLPVDFYGFALDKGFVVGYGLDCAEAYRQLDAIYELTEPASAPRG
ncbi:hypoxanthine phosphoribosyltransferase [Desulfovermiculus halophilus]|jgi:hypoxanthine phosphoribosyltransferase|uniref:hypoxanthine phosphoribosyltransferase n=1 Tax=Desulfovermiculus halophilus TaxID=339722 RepID=UPI0005515715|nr:hypoxanthine phosphoribosyltransferase [Desulfovermiculus halophilus]